MLNIAPWILSDGGSLDVDGCPDCWERRSHMSGTSSRATRSPECVFWISAAALVTARRC